jgi:hypothetical protein
MAHPKIQEMIDLAAADIKRLRVAQSCEAARNAWVDFLEHSNRAINRLEGYSRRTNQTPKYKKLLNDEIWSTELTKYMRVVRNAHEHGIGTTGEPDPLNERIVFPDGRIFGGPTVYGTNAEGEMVLASTKSGPMEWSASPGARVVALKPTVCMVPVLSPKGETLMPPFVQISAEDEPEVVAAARLYLDWVVAKVGTFA